jgi:rod shape-determining protein MreB
MLSASRGTTADLALDLGSSRTRVVVRSQGLVRDVPTVVALQSGPNGRTASAVGEEAHRMLGRTSTGTQVVRPVRGGVITQFEAAEHLLRHLVRESLPRARHPRLLTAVPTDASEVERRAMQESARAAGGREVHHIPSVLAAALGAQLPIFEPVGTMLLDVGAGRTEVSVISLGGLVVQRTVHVGGDTFDAHLVAWLKRTKDLLIGEPTAERVKIEVGGALPPRHARRVRIRGRDLKTGAPSTFDIDGHHIAEALQDVTSAIRKGVLAVLSKTPPEVCADIQGSGVILTGDGARLSGLDTLLSEATGLPFLLAEEPGRCVARGLQQVLDSNELYDRLVHTS